MKNAIRFLLAPLLAASSAWADALADLYPGEFRFAEDGRERPAISNGTFRLGGRREDRLNCESFAERFRAAPNCR